MKLVIYNESIDQLLLSAFNTQECEMRSVKQYNSVEAVLKSVNDVSKITHLAFLYHFNGNFQVPFYNDVSPENNMKNSERISSVFISGSKYMYFSDNVVNLIRSLNSNETLVVDILSCNMNGDSFRNEAIKLGEDLGVKVRYSVDLTGNFPANWTMESDGSNIKSEYFNSNINNWKGTLSGDTGDSARNGEIYGIEYENNTFTLTEDITWNPEYYIILNAGEKFDGSGYTIVIDSDTAFGGLFAINNSVSNFSQAPEIYNLKITGSESGLASGAGYFVRNMQKFFKIHHCSSSGIIGISGEEAELSGGIVGAYAGHSGKCTIYNCYSIGNVLANWSGGIAGDYAGYMGDCTIYNCYSTGNIIGSACGGITGSDEGINGGKCTIYNCYSTGDITGTGSGGITGILNGQLGFCTIYNCYSTGNVSGHWCGGISGPGAGAGKDGAMCVIYNCYSSGQLSGNAAGISGVSSGYGDKGACIIYNCYSSGKLVDNAAGIVGFDPNNSDPPGFLLVLQNYSRSAKNPNTNIYNIIREPLHGNYDVSLLYDNNVNKLNNALTYSTPGYTSGQVLFSHSNSTVYRLGSTNNFMISHNPNNVKVFYPLPLSYPSFLPVAFTQYRNTKIDIPTLFTLNGIGTTENVSFEIITLPSNGSLVMETDNTYTYTSSDAGADSFTYVLIDGNNMRSRPATFYINTISDDDLLELNNYTGLTQYGSISFDGTTWTFGHLTTNEFFVFPNTNNTTVTFLGLCKITKSS